MEIEYLKTMNNLTFLSLTAFFILLILLLKPTHSSSLSNSEKDVGEEWDINLREGEDEGKEDQEGLMWGVERGSRLEKVLKAVEQFEVSVFNNKEGWEGGKSLRVLGAIDAVIIANVHNAMRTDAQGSDMHYLRYNNQLAALAQQWTDGCSYKYGTPSSFNPSAVGWSKLGQNIWASTNPFQPAYALVDWRKQLYKYSYQTNTCASGSQCNAYTQLVWANTTDVGCGVTVCPSLTVDGKTLTNANYFSCYYGPPGNVPDSSGTVPRPFIAGPLCTKCNNGVFYCNYGLCDSSCTAPGPTCKCSAFCKNGGSVTSACTCNCKNRATGSDCTVVNLWKKNGSANQIWFCDPLTGTIRGKQSQLCLEINGEGRLVIDVYDEDCANQKWRYNADKGLIENARNRVMVLEALGKGAGAEVGQQELKPGASTQSWSLVPLPVEYFMIRSAVTDKVLDVYGKKTNPGTKVVLYEMNKPKLTDNQLWFEDFMGNVRSKLSDKIVLDGSKHVITTGEYKDGKEQLFWVICGNKLVNKDNWNEVIEVKNNQTMDGAELCVADYRGLDNQHWDIEYV